MRVQEKVPETLRRSCRLMLLLALATAPIATSAQTDRLSPFVGRWKLDKERSDSPNEMMKALEVPWYARAAATAFTPTLDITARDGAIQVESTLFFGTRIEKIHPDQVERRGEDILGRAFRETSRWTDTGGIDTRRRLSLKDSEASISAVWNAKGDTLNTTIHIALEDGSKIAVRRVFARQLDD